MTSRERVLASIRHEETDRPPVHSMGFQDTQAVREALGVRDDEAAHERLGLDIRAIAPSYRGPPSEMGDDGIPLDVWGVTRGTGRLGPTYTMDLPRPLARAETIADIERHPWPSADWWDYEAAAEACRAHRGRFALKGPGWHPVFCWVCHLMGMQRALEDLAVRPEPWRRAFLTMLSVTWAMAPRSTHSRTSGRGSSSTHRSPAASASRQPVRATSALSGNPSSAPLLARRLCWFLRLKS